MHSNDVTLVDEFDRRGRNHDERLPLRAAVQQIVIQDDIPPTASNPQPMMLECDGSVPPPDPSVVTDASDNCGATVVEFVSDVSDNGSCPETITRTYSVTDDCGNSIFVEQSLIIQDTTPPQLEGTLQPEINVSCGQLFNSEAIKLMVSYPM